MELAPPHAREVLVRLHASGVCHSDWNAVDGTAPTRCPAVLGHEGAGVVEAVGGDVTRVRVGDHVALSWAPSCGVCAECLRDLPWLCSTAWPAMATGGLLDGTTRLSRDGEPVFHYSFLSTFAEACVVPRALLRSDSRRRSLRDRRSRRLRGDDGSGRGLAHRRRASGRPRRRDRVRWGGTLCSDGRRCGGGRAGGRSGRHGGEARGGEGLRRNGRGRLGRHGGGDRGGSPGGERRRGRLCDRGDGAPGGDARRGALDSPPRSCRPDRHPTGGRRGAAAGVDDAPHGAPGAGVDLRLVEARARLPGDARTMARRSSAARPARHPSPPARPRSSEASS